MPGEANHLPLQIHELLPCRADANAQLGAVFFRFGYSPTCPRNASLACSFHLKNQSEGSHPEPDGSWFPFLDGRAGRKVRAELMELLVAAACVTPGSSPSTHQMFATSIPRGGTVPAPRWAHPARKLSQRCWVLPPAPTRFGDSPPPAPHRRAGSDFD